MKGNFRRSMIWLHTYSGLLLSWLIFIVFVSGTLSYYADEINIWMQPEQAPLSEKSAVIPLALKALNAKGEAASRWSINLGSLRDPKAQIRWQLPNQSRREQKKVNLFDTKQTTRATVGGDFFVRFHYALELRNYGGRYLSGIAAFIMLIAIFSGVFTHRRFFKDFFFLRWKDLKRALTDIHAIIGIITIPFCFMICASALLFYVSMYMPASATYNYDKGYRELSSHVSPQNFSRESSGIAAVPITDISAILTHVNDIWQEPNNVSRVNYDHPYDKNGYLTFYRHKLTNLSRQSETLVFDAATGSLLHETAQSRTPKLISNVFLGIHEAKFADNSLRFILFLLGCLSCGLIATGTLLWINSRVQRQVYHVGTTLITWSNRSVFAGLPLAIIGLFYANRLLPITMVERESYEVLTFFLCWLACAIFAIKKHNPRYWYGVLSVFSIACFFLPLFDLLSPEHYLLNAVKNSNINFLMVELALVVFGGLAWWLKMFLYKKQVSNIEPDPIAFRQEV
jgi:uncharacterized iron-regulated membrane protein